MTPNPRLLTLALSLLVSIPATASGSPGADPTRTPDPRHPYLVPGAPSLPAAPVTGSMRGTTGSGGAAVLGEWTRVPRTFAPATGGGGLAYDAARGELLSFGGCCFEGDLWAFKEGAWQIRNPGLVAPGARAGNAMAYDPIRRETVMFGGSQYAETWIWNGTEWRIYHQVDGPTFRSDTAMAWMPKIGKIVMFGGYPDVDPNEIGTQLEDTWTWDGTAWKRMTTANVPPARYGPGLAADPATGNLVMFGGLSDDYESLGDTWIFDGSDWRQVETPTAPEPRSYLSMESNPALGAVELFGGYKIERLDSLGDRWFFTGGEWTQQLPGIENGPLPPARISQTLTYDANSQRMTLFGGSWCKPTCGGVWTERLEETTREDGTIERRLVWDHTPPTWPSNRMGATRLVPDPHGRGALLFGGSGDSSGTGEPNDTWAWDGGWSKLETTNAPPGRQGSSIAVHDRTKTVVVFGGSTGYQQYDGRTWVLDGNTWEARQPEVSPPVRYQTAMAEDANGNVVLFGGFKPLGGASVERLGDTWIWDGERWTQHFGTGPPARAYPQMAYDPVRKETVLFGGSGADGVNLGDTWVWDGTGWEQRAPSLSPPGRLGSAIAWDPAGQQVVLFGGVSGSTVGLITADVWTWDGTTWLKAEAPMGGPGARWFSMAGSTDQGIVLYGGHGGGTGLQFSDTWLWRETA